VIFKNTLGVALADKFFPATLLFLFRIFPLAPQLDLIVLLLILDSV
jgi:hypothetical protein